MSAYKNLSSEEYSYFQSMASLSFFTTKEQMDLRTSWGKRELEVEEETLQPYCDLLMTQIMNDVRWKKDEILAALQEKTKTAKHKADLCVPFWSYNSVIYKQSRQEAFGGRSYFTDQDEIREKGYDWTLKTERYVTDPAELEEIGHFPEYDGPSAEVTKLRPVRVDRVVKRSDLLLRLSKNFGMNFWVSTRLGKIIHECESYTAYKVELVLNFFPSGLPEHRIKALLPIAKKYDARTNYRMKDDERFILWQGNPVATLASTLETFRKEARSFGPADSCGCGFCTGE